VTEGSVEYTQRLEERQQRMRHLAARERLLGNGRVIVFLAGLVLAVFAFGPHLLSGWWLFIPLAAYVVLLVQHERVTRAWRRAGRAVAYYQAGLARLADDWRGKGTSGERFLDDTHTCAADLDLFGKGSLFELLCTARTRRGEDTLAAWLKKGSDPQEVRARQAAVAELRPMLDLREDLAILGSDVRAGVDFDAVIDWGETPPILPSLWLRWVALVLGAITTVTLCAWVLALTGFLERPEEHFLTRYGSLEFGAALIVQLVFSGWLLARSQRVLAAVDRRGRELAMLSSVLARLEQADFTAPKLIALRTALDTPPQSLADSMTSGRAVPPSQRIAQLGNLLDLLESRRNQFFAPFAYAMMWGTQMAFAIEKWRRTVGPAIGRWINVVGELEALCSLASYAFESPGDPFPEIVEEGACYEGAQLGHPLLPGGKCVRNDLRLDSELRVLVVSGSNMSGKSTFLRTVGINAVLALAGAPVRANRLRLSPLAIGATLRIQDSLQAGRSRFYAEVLRVRQIVDLTRGPVPLLFLLDEIFAGTNSHDRRLGAEAVVRGLIRAGAIGLVTTHDLSLTHIAEIGKGANVHFADHFENGVMTFDYRLRPGVVQHSNALALMRAVGLEV
jgi:hypothetical protein